MDTLDFLYEDDSLLALGKAPGLHTAPLGGEGERAVSLLTQLLAQRPELASLPGRKPCEPGLLHRLDRETSGVVLVAKTEEAFRKLLESQERGLFFKEYRAYCRPSSATIPGAKPGRASLDANWIRSRFRPYGPRGARVAPIGTDRAEIALEEEGGPLYETELLQIVERGSAFPADKDCRLRLYRGYRHQLRAHLAWIGLPIIGDPLYAKREESSPDVESKQDMGRMYLHAESLEFPHPQTGKIIRIVCPSQDYGF